ncbi:tyrosinase [Hirsutella rhossiliensis]|uniref:Tyrosinase n=1 Tax=Hirsutella rhossiliensis TaxID=111463 RepID=A0A9P8MUU1_9HYPO|nr:tyrosinase [Hirsutella rhossiliensis]KAH0961817.1 tyrosinase [Hirsutella rhossiliensis]
MGMFNRVLSFLPGRQQGAKYDALGDEESSPRGSSVEPGPGNHTSATKETQRFHETFLTRKLSLGPIPLAAFCLLLLSLGFLAGEFLQDNGLIAKIQHEKEHRDSHCENPQKRVEWRSLSAADKDEYIRAVQCLSARPSKTRSHGNLYDDFPFVRAYLGRHTTGAASFLPWNRYFLHVYQQMLRNECGYNGSLMYWDWTVDWESMASSDVFSATVGFGGNGNASSKQGVDEAFCVTDGPFANLTLTFASSSFVDPKIHCLSRRFHDGQIEGRIAGDQAKPAVIEQILGQEDYDRFLVQLQSGPSQSISASIGGDFSQYSGPNDPLYILHLRYSSPLPSS